MNRKIALVTGGVKGIGKAICIALKNNGYVIAANYLKEDDLAEDLHSEHGIHTYKFDVSDFHECESSIPQIEKDLSSHIEILINNAGITADKMLHNMSHEEFQRVINVNLCSCFNTCKIIYPKMRENRFGRIVNISSVNAITGQAGQTNYAASKAGVIGFTKSLARECASKGITVNAIAPGYTDTEMLHSINERILKDITSSIPTKRLAAPQEIASTVLFLASEEASYITGSTININGGIAMI